MAHEGRTALVLMISALFASSLIAQPSGGPPPARVVVDEARLETIEPRREVTGELRALRRSVIAAEHAGLVVELSVEEGDSVEHGQTIVRLDDKLVRIELERARAETLASEAAVDAFEAQLARANRDYDRILSIGDAASDKEVVDARSDVIIAEAELAAARAESLASKAREGLIEARLEDMVVRAPFAGQVVAKLTEVGQWIGAGESVIELIDVHQIDAWLDVPERLIGRLGRHGVEAQIRLRATGEVFAAPVSSIVPQADPLSRLFPVRVRLDNHDGRLFPGMSIVGLAPTGAREEMTTIHKDALLRDDAGTFVFYNADGAASVARVRVLFAKENRLVIESGPLGPGVGVVIEGNERLFPGQPLEIVTRGSSGGETR